MGTLNSIGIIYFSLTIRSHMKKKINAFEVCVFEMRSGHFPILINEDGTRTVETWNWRPLRKKWETMVPKKKCNLIVNLLQVQSEIHTEEYNLMILGIISFFTMEY